ncbi:hypothetical protein Bequi_11355 [Brachybacterium sp. JHP9]|uniref:Uncharacterized protein n=1 Tax=Brachybacterium equifaecis TaxID=2910770 RepID=A0ABT0R3I1_9MICO|nr:DUF6541 family protein [Brachybacterium equifaecis]MCL6423968.1 hypothetical protein [Brachybacterium equifaecis]
MSGWAELLAAVGACLLIVYLPGALLGRALCLSWRTALGAAPAASAGILGALAALAPVLDLRWNLVTTALSLAQILVLAVGATILAQQLSARLHPRTGSPAAAARSGRDVLALPPLLGARPALSLLCIGAAVAIALSPILLALGSPSSILQRWDTLFHLSAVQFVRSGGDGSSLHLAAVADPHWRPGVYPAAFHDIAALVPFAPVPVVLNASVIALAIVPWVHGIAFLARVLWPRLAWAPTAAALAAALAPAVPLNLWIHLSPIPNLVAFGMLPGVLGMLVLAFRALRVRRTPLRTELVAPLVVAAAGAAGLALTHPNVLAMASLLVAAGALADLLGRRGAGLRRWSLLWIPALALAPMIALRLLPGASVTTTFDGGLAVPGWTGAGELLLGLLTVWPMALGMLVWALAYLGIWAQARRGSWPLLAWAVVVGVLYFDAAVDSPLRLSDMWYRGQDRISMAVTLVACLLVVPGLAHLARLLRGRGMRWLRPLGAALAILAVLASIPARWDYAELNLDLDRRDRPRFFDTEELAMLESIAPTMDRDLTVLANPFSGGAHLYGISGQSVRWASAGVNPDAAEGALMDAALRADRDPQACRALREAGIGYVYTDSRPYHRGGSFARVDQVPSSLGRVIGSTPHSMMIEVDCSEG